jgi:hypothetical protein
MMVEGLWPATSIQSLRRASSRIGLNGSYVEFLVSESRLASAAYEAKTFLIVFARSAR